MMVMMDEGTFIIKSFVSTSNSSVFAIVMNYALISALAAFVIAQLAKFFITWCNERRWDAKILIGSGGMPSSHSATVAALATTIGFENGFQGSAFATALILALVVMHDALGVRLHAGRQAKVLNQIVYELPAEHPLSESSWSHSSSGFGWCDSGNFHSSGRPFNQDSDYSSLTPLLISVTSTFRKSTSTINILIQ